MPISRKILFLSLMILCQFSAPKHAWADDEDIPFGLRMPYRIVRGITNVALGWTEILLRPFGEHKTENVGEAMSQGASNTVIRASAGFTDIVTFWVPDIKMLDLYSDWQGWPYLFHWS